MKTLKYSIVCFFLMVSTAWAASLKGNVTWKMEPCNGEYPCEIQTEIKQIEWVENLWMVVKCDNEMEFSVGSIFLRNMVSAIISENHKINLFLSEPNMISKISFRCNTGIEYDGDLFDESDMIHGFITNIKPHPSMGGVLIVTFSNGLELELCDSCSRKIVTTAQYVTSPVNLYLDENNIIWTYLE